MQPMWRWIPLLATIAVTAAAAQGTAGPSQPEVPAWAFPPPQTSSVPGSAHRFSDTAIFDRTRPVDWFPDDHPPAPDAVKGRAQLFACGYCHSPDGGGRPENTALAGLSEPYIVRLLADMKSGARAYDPHFTTGVNMVLVAQLSSDPDVRAAAAYFAGLTYRKRLSVVEARDIPRAAANSVYFFDTGGAMEPLGQRIVEGPDDAERFRRRDPHTTYTAYVPPGSVARGAALARGTAGHPACDTCHGTGLRGGPDAPPLAGRFATAQFRQLYDFSRGLRSGVQAAPMTAAVAGLSQSDMIALAAYAASLEP